MKEYYFEVSTTTKPKDRGCWYIDIDYIKNQTIKAESLPDAVNAFIEKVNAEHYGSFISKNAAKNKQPIYIDDENGDAVQIGYIITAKTLFDKGNYNGFVNKYIDLWLAISEKVNPFSL